MASLWHLGDLAHICRGHRGKDTQAKPELIWILAGSLIILWEQERVGGCSESISRSHPPLTSLSSPGDCHGDSFPLPPKFCWGRSLPVLSPSEQSSRIQTYLAGVWSWLLSNGVAHDSWCWHQPLLFQCWPVWCVGQGLQEASTFGCSFFFHNKLSPSKSSSLYLHWFNQWGFGFPIAFWENQEDIRVNRFGKHQSVVGIFVSDV